MYSTLNRKVKECFILADMGKDFTAISLRDHLTKFGERKREVETWTNTQIDRIIRKGQNPPRTHRFNKWNWELKVLPLNILGVYPKMCELPDRYCIEAVPQTATYIKRLLECSEKIRADELTNEVKKRLLKLRQIWEMMRKSSKDELNQYLQMNPIIVIKGGAIRGSLYCRKKGYRSFDWDIDDGSSRAVIYTIIGLKMIMAYAGVPL